ncbi:BQ2448_5033 [Microbotryum intermedium]|uniref:CST complex subunit STN1 n=1 Tax=Microbotryum intermedium TaxID=269621 RepID=A0A238EZX2_9BASI|nr:BQ2448_5033 [Microbotryum intermedium]
MSTQNPRPIEVYTQPAYVYQDPAPTRHRPASSTTQAERRLTSSSSSSSSSYAPSNRSAAAHEVVRPSSSSTSPPERPGTRQAKTGPLSGKSASSRNSSTSHSARRPIPSSSSSKVSMAEASSSSRLSGHSSTSTQRKRSKSQPGDGFAMDFGQPRTASPLLPLPLPPPPPATRLTLRSEDPIASTSRVASHSSPRIRTLDAQTTPIRLKAVGCDPVSTPRASQHQQRSTTPQNSPEPFPRPPMEVIFLSSSPEPISSVSNPSFSTPRAKASPQVHPSICARLAALDEDVTSDPHLAPSILFQCEVVNHGPATYDQRDDAERKKWKRNRKGRPQGEGLWPWREGPAMPSVAPSWIGDRVNVDKLKRRIEEKEHFVANVRVKDVVDDTSSQGMRELNVDGVEMCILGNEFPLKRVILVGTIVGDDWKNDKIVYYVDDGTGVVACLCTAQERPPLIALPDEAYQVSLTKRRRKRKVLDPIPDSEIDSTFEVGTLVRVLARVEKASFAFAGMRHLSVIRIEALKNPTAFVTHQLLVHQLHQHIYSQPFDLALRFEEIHQADLSIADTTSDALSTPPPSSSKKYRLPRASKLLPEDLTPSTFAQYIKFYLKRHFVEYRTNTSKEFELFPVDFGETPSDPEIPIEFTLDDLKKDRDLVKFATRMVKIQFMETRRVKTIKQERILKGNKKVAWVENARWQTNGVTLLAPPGSRGGSGLFLDDVLREGTAGTERMLRRLKRDSHEAEVMLDGDKLDRAIDKAFTAALIHLREHGEIILTPKEAESDALEQLLGPEREPDPEHLPDQPEWGDQGDSLRKSIKNPSTRIKERHPWALEGFFSSPESKRSSSPTQETTPRPLGEHRASQGNNKVQVDGWDFNFGTPTEGEERSPAANSRMAAPSFVQQRSSRKPCPWFSPPPRPIQTYQLVTTTSLLVPVYRIITNVYTASMEACAATWSARQHVSVIEEQIRGALLNDEVLEQVGRKSHLVNEAVNELVKLKKVEWVTVGDETTGHFFVEGVKNAVRLTGVNEMGAMAKKSKRGKK